jgi:hypothetical protein
VTTGIAPPSDAELRACAGDASVGRVLIRGDLGRVCLAVVDTNGDGAFLAAVALHLDDDGAWRESAWNRAAVLGTGWVHGVAYLYGRAPRGSSVDVVSRGRVHRVPVNDEGWWLCLEEAEPDEPLPWLA